MKSLYPIVLLLLISFMMACSPVDNGGSSGFRYQMGPPTKGSLHEAVMIGDTTKVTEFIDNATDKESLEKELEKEQEGFSPLHYAVYYGRTTIAQLLIDASVSLDQGDDNGATALHWSIKSDYDGLINDTYNTARATAAVANQTLPDFTAITQLLLDSGANINTQDNKGRSSLHEAALKNRIEAAKLLIDRKASIDIRDNEGRTPLHDAILNNMVAVAELLIDKGADPDLLDKAGKSARQYAEQRKEKKILTALTPMVRNFYRLNNNLVLLFNSPLSAFDKEKITVHRATQRGREETLTNPQDYTILWDSKNENKKIIIILTAIPVLNDQYTVNLQLGAVTGSNNGLGKAFNHSITINGGPVLNNATPVYLLGEILVITFDSDVWFLDTSKIRIESQESGANFQIVEIPDDNIKIDIQDRRKLKITLPGTPQTGITLKSTLLPGALRNLSEGNVQLDVPSIRISTPPGLDENLAPVIINQTLIITFKQPIRLLAPSKTRVKRKESASVRGFSDLNIPDKNIAIDKKNSHKLNIVLPSKPKEGEIYRIELQAGAVRDGDIDAPVLNLPIAPTDKDITVKLPAGSSWEKIKTKTIWPERNGHTSVVFNNKIWVLGGLAEGKKYKNDVWSSQNGKDWTEETKTAAWSAREEHSSVVFDDGNGEKIWILGGKETNTSFKNDVWSSQNGKDWTEETKTAAWTQRYAHSSVTFQNKIWVMGGWASNAKNDVWSSADGKTWNSATTNASWGVRYKHKSVVFKDKIWVLGGIANSNIWFSSNGTDWTQANKLSGEFAPDWLSRNSFSAVVSNGNIVLMGGVNGANPFNDVWFSPDGENWNSLKTSAKWTVRYSHTSVLFNNKIWLMGGDAISSNKKNDVWIGN